MRLCITVKFEEVLMKTFVGQQKPKSTFLEPFAISAATLFDFSKKLWHQAQEHLKFLAIKDESDNWLLGPRPLSSDVLMMPVFIEIKRNNYHYVPVPPRPRRPDGSLVPRHYTRRAGSFKWLQKDHFRRRY